METPTTNTSGFISISISLVCGVPTNIPGKHLAASREPQALHPRSLLLQEWPSDLLPMAALIWLFFKVTELSLGWSCSGLNEPASAMKEGRNLF